jgi:chromosome segregation ATPase
MALSDKARGHGWQDQAIRLAVTHGTWGGTPNRAESSLAAAATAFDAVDAAAAELADELELARARAAGLERRLAEEMAAKQTLREQFETADARIAELENDLAATYDELALRDNENQSLRTSLDLAMAENSGLTERLAKSDAAQHATGSQLEYLQTALTAAETECARLLSEVGDRLFETSTLNGRLAAISSRAEIAERLLADARECLLARIAENTTTERNLADATAARRDAERELHQLQDLLRLKQCQINELEQARLKLIAATNALLKTCQGRDAALVQADDEIKTRNARIAQLEAQVREANSRREAVTADIQSPQTAIRAAADDANDKTRKKWAELARELAKLAKLKPQLVTPIKASSTPSLLASTITF